MPAQVLNWHRESGGHFIQLLLFASLQVVIVRNCTNVDSLGLGYFIGLGVQTRTN